MKKSINGSILAMVLVLILGLLMSAISNADIRYTEEKLTANDINCVGGEEFGSSVSISGDYAIVGEPYDYNYGKSTGSAYIFKRNGETDEWGEDYDAKLTANDISPAGGEKFGFSVSISGDYIIIGAHGDDGMEVGAGSAYIFKRNGETDEWGGDYDAKLIASDGESGDAFGFSVSISGDYAIVGSPGSSRGYAYIFKRNGDADPPWTLDATLTPSIWDAKWFGESVSISGDYAIVGALDDNIIPLYSGSAHIFKRNGDADPSWTLDAILRVSDGEPMDAFGHSVSISGDYAIVGAYYAGNGSAYIYERTDSTWALGAILTASDGKPMDAFGYSVSISGDNAIVGAPSIDGNGSAYFFKRTESLWIQDEKLTASDGASKDWFGRSVSISGDNAIIGAHGDDGMEEDTGSAYVYQMPPPSPAQAIEDLITTIEGMNLQQGIDNSLDAKLQAVQDAIEALNADLRNDAINKLEAFINAVEAQRGKTLTDEQADMLVSLAENIILALY